MSKYKLDSLSRVLDDAKKVKPIENMNNVYTPDDYAKLRRAELVMGQMNSGDYLRADTDLGAVEFDERGNLKKVGRTRPAMLDLGLYTANRYMIKQYTTEQEYQAKIPKTDKVEKRTRKNNHVDIYVVTGIPIVKAITETRELPPTVRAFKFSRTQKNHYVYKGATFIKSEECYKMTKFFSPQTMLYLMQLIEEARTKSADSNGDDFASIEEELKTTTEEISPEVEE